MWGWASILMIGIIGGIFGHFFFSLYKIDVPKKDKKDKVEERNKKIDEILK